MGDDRLKRIISDALYNYKESVDVDQKGKRPWGQERSDWRADAIIAALAAAGITLTTGEKKDAENG